jgi:oligopeptide/dipeptide ABC transporter ATP-binding protein
MRDGPVGSVLFISHHLGLVSQLCDTVCVMYGGTLVETGAVDAVIGRPLHPYTQALLACEIDEGSGRLLTIPGEVPDPAVELAGCIFAARCARAEPACRTVTPPLARKAPGHRAACILVADA